MKENKLGTYLTSFSEKDWAAYHKFSKSLYNKNSDYQLIINYIKKNKDRYDPSYMDGEYLRKKIRPTASKQVFANGISRLCKYIEEYMVWAELEKDEMMKDTLLLQALGKRGLTTQFYQHKERARKRREEKPSGLWPNYHDFMSEYLHYYCNIVSSNREGKESLEKIYAYFDQFYVTLKGFVGIELHNRTIVLSEDWTSYYEEIKYQKIDNDLIKDVYRHLMILKEHRDHSSFEKLKEILLESNLDEDIRYIILIHLTSYINRQRVRGEINDGKETLQLYQYGLDNNLLFPNGLLPFTRFVNILGVACRHEEYEWAHKFVENYAAVVSNNSEDENKILGKSHIEFNRGDFEKVILSLRNQKFKNFEVESRARWYFLCSTYELNKDDPVILEYYINSFIQFLKRNRLNIAKLKIEALKNSAMYLLKISKSNFTTKFSKDLKNEKTLFFRKWLFEKATEKLNK